MQKIEIIPAIMPSSYNELKTALNAVQSAEARWIQIDVMDKTYTQKATWPYVSTPDIFFEKLINEEEALLGWDKSSFEIDMMIVNPEKEIEKWIKAGATRFILHLHAIKDVSEIMSQLRKQYPVDGEWKIEFVLAIKPFENTESVQPFLEYFDGIQVMGIDPVGVQGAELDTRVYDTIKNVRETTDMPISVDGGVNEENAGGLVDAGANRLVSGSFVFKHELGPKFAISELKSSI